MTRNITFPIKHNKGEKILLTAVAWKSIEQ